MTEKFKIIKASSQSMVENYRLMVASIAPRPIAFVGTQNLKGNDNLAPFSFFNGFGANPPIIGFSPALSGRTGKPKDTLLNIQEVKEFTISMVSFEMAEQMSLSSCEYPIEVDEFSKSGFKKNNSNFIKPHGVFESPVIFECKLVDIVKLGSKPGSGNLILGEVVAFHVKENLFKGDIFDEKAMDLVGRMGYGNYVRSQDSVFTINKPKCISIGFDALPDKIKNSEQLKGSHLAKLASVDKIPPYKKSNDSFSDLYKECIHRLDQNKIDDAWQIVHQILRYE
ncbi:MAG: flavin reductase family protein [Pelagibacteraceae bacterium TMED124]|nr:MAG: flavin reductase family protein [Pelagibacteraceae bacterium TMED124]